MKNKKYLTRPSVYNRIIKIDKWKTLVNICCDDEEK